ncbi:MAG: SDR family oxidoreductase [bacterium]|nr:short-chain dehydrogenase [Deltaproteobacteria bacterium]MCP4908812.1 SDR family oxidoreductase [bacterium]
MGLENKVIIVTGAAGGIGECYARRLVDEGARVVVADLDDERGQRVTDEIRRGGGDAFYAHVDVADPESAQELANRTVEYYGGIDGLVNNAAIYAGMKLEPLISVDLAYYRRFLDVNLSGALHCTRACYPAIAERGGGSIVNQSSSAAWMTHSFYSLAKASLNSLTVCLAHELGEMGIRVNAIAPGLTDTEATRGTVAGEVADAIVSSLAIKRLGRPEDQNGALVFLLSDDSAWVTGQILSVDGGGTLRL